MTCVISLLYTIQCNWNAPYTLPEFPISKYNINITNEEELVKQVSLTGTLDTQYTYNVSEFGTYTISITAVISEDLEGEKNEKIVNIETGKLYYFMLRVLINNFISFLVFIVHITDYDIGIRIENGNWIINTIIRVSPLILIALILY